MPKNKNTGLGRGLDAIFIDNSVEDSGNVTMLRISEIEPNPDQPRREFDPEALSQLADSIATHGLIQPIVVRSAGTDGLYQIIAGERRWRASKMAGLTEIPVIVKELDDSKAAQVALIENIQREDLNPIEEAAGYRSLMDEYSMTQEEVAKQVGKSRSAVANSTRLLDLPDGVKELVKTGQLSAGHAKVLLSVHDEDEMVRLALNTVSKSLSVRETEKAIKVAIRRIKQMAQQAKALDDLENGRVPVDYTAELAKKMTARLGHRVTIKKSAGDSRIEIHFADDAELGDIVADICGDNIFDE